MSDSIPYKSGGSLPRLAPDLTWPSRKFPGDTNFERITGIDGTTGGLVTVLSLSGKLFIPYVLLSVLINESITLKLTIDGVVVWNSTFTVVATSFLAIGRGPAASAPSENYVCNSTFLLEITTITANGIRCDYVARPIL